MESSDNSLPHNGRDTSIAAAESMEEIAVHDRVRVLKRLVMIEPDGANADATQVYLRMEHQSNSPRFGELEESKSSLAQIPTKEHGGG